MNKIFNALFIILMLMCTEIYTCTGIRIICSDGSVVYARTLEFAMNIKSKILFMPRDYEFVGNTPRIDNSNKNLNGLEWKSKYATLGSNGLNYNYFIDGINELGLAGGVFYFPDYAGYQKIDINNPNDYKNSLAAWQLLTWILTTCANINEVKNKISTIKVTDATFPAWNKTLPLHYIIHDPSGKSLIIEYTKGKLNLYDNHLGVITNSPTFDWHITNLRNYINLTALNVPKVKLEDITLTPIGQGSGMLGLPGDFTPPSRFIRATAFTESIIQPNNSIQGINSAFHILNLFNIPKGIVRSANDQTFNYTQWTSASDLKNLHYYFNTYNNRQIFKLDLNKLKDYNKVLNISMFYKQKIYSITPNLKK